MCRNIIILLIYLHHKLLELISDMENTFVPVTVAEGSKAWTVFARSKAGIVSSNPTQGMDVWCMCLFCVCVVLCLGRGLATSWSLLQGVLPSVKWSWNWKAEAGAQGGCTASEKNTFVIWWNIQKGWTSEDRERTAYGAARYWVK
jgi:hypothetical protein